MPKDPKAQPPIPCPVQLLSAIRLVAMDVDGVLTSGAIVLGASFTGKTPDQALEFKSFHVKDGLGIGLLHSVGLETAWITGRVSPIVERRAAELGVRNVCQWARNKRAVLEELSARLGLEKHQVLYVGDDLNDLPAFEAAGVRVAVSDASDEVLARADWITAAPGGHGAVREVVEGLLKAQGRWEEAMAAFLERLSQEAKAPGSSPVNQ